MSAPESSDSSPKQRWLTGKRMIGIAMAMGGKLSRYRRVSVWRAAVNHGVRHWSLGLRLTANASTNVDMSTFKD